MRKGWVMRRICGLLMLAVTSAAAAAAAAEPAPLEPDAAIAAAAADPDGVHGRFVMTVRAVGHEGGLAYLNSATDYRAADNLTFTLPPSAQRALARKAGGPLASVIGRRVTVEGIVRNVPIALTRYGRPVRVIRVQHMVTLRQAGGVVAVD